MQEKARRQQRLLALIRSKPISTQGELVSELSRAGWEINQSSVSRDLEELGIQKKRGFYELDGGTSADAHPRSHRQGWLLSLREAGDSLLVARSKPGLASALTVEIDAAKIPEIVGTIAGDDTVMIAVNGRRAQRRAVAAILRMFS